MALAETWSSKTCGEGDALFRRFCSLVSQYPVDYLFAEVGVDYRAALVRRNHCRILPPMRRKDLDTHHPGRLGLKCLLLL